MKTQQRLILASIGVVLAASAFVVVRARRPPPPAPADATLLLPGKALGPYAIGMTREAALSLRRPDQKKVDPEARADEVGDGTYSVKVRDGRVVSITTSSFGNGISVGGAWIQSTAAVEMARALSHTIGNCSEHFQPVEGMGGWSGPWFDCHGTRIEVDQGRGYLTVIVGAY